MNKKLLLVLSLALFALLALFVACGGDDEDTSRTDGFATNTPGATIPQATAEPTADTSDCPAPSGDAPEPDLTKTYSSAPEMTIDTAKTYTATIKTVRGDITVKLRPDLAPQHVNSFVFLAREGFYDGVTFHRVLPGFVAQAGDPTGTGSGGPGYNIPAEFSDPSVAKFERGTLGMARSQAPDSAGSQWFINYAATPSLDGAYTIFGEVTDGMDVVDCITPRDPSQNPNAPLGDAIITIEITES